MSQIIITISCSKCLILKQKTLVTAIVEETEVTENIVIAVDGATKETKNIVTAIVGEPEVTET